MATLCKELSRKQKNQLDVACHKFHAGQGVLYHSDPSVAHLSCSPVPGSLSLSASQLITLHPFLRRRCTCSQLSLTQVTLWRLHRLPRET